MRWCMSKDLYIHKKHTAEKEVFVDITQVVIIQFIEKYCV